MKPNPNILIDRMVVSELGRSHPNIFDLLSDQFPKSIANKDKVQFCGVLCPSGGKPHAFMPRGFKAIDKSDIPKLVMRTLARFGNDVESRVGNSSVDGQGPNFAATIHNIAADYMKYGIYSQRLRIRSKNAGKPDWKRTLQRRMPLINKLGKPIYLTLDSSRFLSASENILALVQAETLRDIIAKHGWWVGLNQSALSDIASVPIGNIPKEQFAYQIERFKVHLFDDRSLQLASFLQQYWTNSAAQLDGGFICGVSDFSSVWEHMLKSTVDDASKTWNARLPMPSYIYDDGSLNPRKKGGEIDIIIDDEDKIIVADAKYYSALSTETAPGFGDILKQSFYSKGVQSMAAEKPVVSVFVFPTWDNNSPLTLGGFYDRGTDSSTDWLDDVDCIYVDVLTLMQKYVTKQQWNWYSASVT